VTLTHILTLLTTSEHSAIVAGMNEAEFNATVERLKRANAVVAKLDPAIRADSFSVLLPFVKGGDSRRNQNAPGGDEENSEAVDPPGDRDDLLTKHGGEPVDNVLVATAAWYMEFGSTPFSKADIQEILDSAGMTAPVRIDRTLDTTTKGKGKNLFRKQGRGRWVPSVPGEAYFRETFNIKKGNKKPSSESS